MAKGLELRALLAVASVALGCAAAGSARAQLFAPGYPAVIAVPPPAQGMVMPKRSRPEPAPPAAPAPPTVEDAAPNHTCSYQGRTRVCD